MANRIAGLDIGTWSVKAVVLEIGREVEVVGFREIPLSEIDGASGTDGTVHEGEESGSGGGDKMFPEPEDSDKTDEWESPDDDDRAGGEGDSGGDWAGEEIDSEHSGPEEWGEPADEGPAWSRAVARLVREGYFEGINRVITSFPDDESVTLHLEVPFERADEVEEILPHLLTDELPMNVDDLVYDFVVVAGSDPSKWEALIGFVERVKMAAFLDEINDAGVDPAIVGVPELMLRYSGERAVDEDVESYGIIDIGHRYTRLLIMSGDKPVVAHTTRRGGEAITEALAENFQISNDDARQLKHGEGVVGEAARGGDRRVRKLRGTIEEALRPIIRDARRTFQSAYAKHQVAVDKIYIGGGTSRIRGLEKYLHGEFEVDVEAIEFHRRIRWSVDRQFRQRQPEATLVLGTALQHLAGDVREDTIDFRQDEFVFRGKSSYLRTQLVRFGAVAAVLLVLLAGVMFMQYHEQNKQKQVMQQAVAVETEELFGERLTTAAQVQSRLEGEGAMDRGFIPQMSAYELKVRVIETIDDNIPLELSRMEVDTDRSLIQMMGTTDSPQAVDRVASNIEQLECLRDVSKEQVNVEGDDEVQFQLRIASECS